MGDDKLHEIEIILTEVKASDKSSQKRIGVLETDIKSIGQKVQTNIGSIEKSNILLEGLTKTVSEIQESTKSTNKLAFSVHEMASEMKAMREDVNKVDTKVDNHNKSISDRVKIIEDKPAKRYDAIIEKIIFVIVGSIVGYFLMKFGM